MSESAANAGRSEPKWRFRASVPTGMLGYSVLAATLAAYVAVYSTRLHHLPTLFDYTAILDAALPLVFVALGQSLVVLTGGIDLSVGGVMSMCVTLIATQVHGGALRSLAAVGAVLVVGAIAGAVNGLVVARGRIAPILATLATLSIYSGVALKILPEPGGSAPAGLTAAVANPSNPVALLWILLVAGSWFLFRRTLFGLRIFAVGSDESSARAVGVPAVRVKIAVYALSGLFSALGAIAYVATTTTGDPTAGSPFVLTSIAAVVVGGIAFRGGRGSAMGALAGALALTLVIDVLFFAGIDPLYQPLFQGLFLVVAVLLGGGLTLASRLRETRR